MDRTETNLRVSVLRSSGGFSEESEGELGGEIHQKNIRPKVTEEAEGASRDKVPEKAGQGKCQGRPLKVVHTVVPTDEKTKRLMKSYLSLIKFSSVQFSWLRLRVSTADTRLIATVHKLLPR